MPTIVSYTTRPVRVPILATGTVKAGPWQLEVATTPQGACAVGFPGRVAEHQEWLAGHFDAQQRVFVGTGLTSHGKHDGAADAVHWFHATARWLNEYSRGVPVAVPPLVFVGTAFQQEVWRVLLDIPSGKTWTYQQVAQAIGRPRAVRAVGHAIGANPIPIMVPCHRVIGSSGRLVGFGGGLPLKRQLLDFEGASWETG